MADEELKNVEAVEAWLGKTFPDQSIAEFDDAAKEQLQVFFDADNIIIVDGKTKKVSAGGIGNDGKLQKIDLPSDDSSPINSFFTAVNKQVDAQAAAAQADKAGEQKPEASVPATEPSPDESTTKDEGNPLTRNVNSLLMAAAAGAAVLFTPIGEAFGVLGVAIAAAVAFFVSKVVLKLDTPSEGQGEHTPSATPSVQPEAAAEVEQEAPAAEVEEEVAKESAAQTETPEPTQTPEKEVKEPGEEKSPAAAEAAPATPEKPIENNAGSKKPAAAASAEPASDMEAIATTAAISAAITLNNALNSPAAKAGKTVAGIGVRFAVNRALNAFDEGVRSITGGTPQAQKPAAAPSPVKPREPVVTKRGERAVSVIGRNGKQLEHIYIPLSNTDTINTGNPDRERKMKVTLEHVADDLNGYRLASYAIADADGNFKADAAGKLIQYPFPESFRTPEYRILVDKKNELRLHGSGKGLPADEWDIYKLNSKKILAAKNFAITDSEERLRTKSKKPEVQATAPAETPAAEPPAKQETSPAPTDTPSMPPAPAPAPKADLPNDTNIPQNNDVPAAAITAATAAAAAQQAPTVPQNPPANQNVAPAQPAAAGALVKSGARATAANAANNTKPEPPKTTTTKPAKKAAAPLKPPFASPQNNASVLPKSPLMITPDKQGNISLLDAKGKPLTGFIEVAVAPDMIVGAIVTGMKPNDLSLTPHYIRIPRTDWEKERGDLQSNMYAVKADATGHVPPSEIVRMGNNLIGEKNRIIRRENLARVNRIHTMVEERREKLEEAPEIKIISSGNNIIRFDYTIYNPECKIQDLYTQSLYIEAVAEPSSPKSETGKLTLLSMIDINSGDNNNMLRNGRTLVIEGLTTDSKGNIDLNNLSKNDAKKLQAQITPVAIQNVKDSKRNAANLTTSDKGQRERLLKDALNRTEGQNHIYPETKAYLEGQVNPKTIAATPEPKNTGTKKVDPVINQTLDRLMFGRVEMIQELLANPENLGVMPSQPIPLMPSEKMPPGKTSPRKD